MRFREYGAGDLDSVYSMFSDAQARRFYPEMEDRQNCQAWIDWNERNYRDHGFGLWVIEAMDTGEFLGDCGLSFQPVEGDRLLELGYHLAAAHRGKGLATEAGRACIGYALADLGRNFVCSLVHPDNRDSQAVARRLHESEGTYRKDDGSERLIFSTGDRPEK